MIAVIAAGHSGILNPLTGRRSMDKHTVADIKAHVTCARTIIGEINEISGHELLIGNLCSRRPLLGTGEIGITEIAENINTATSKMLTIFFIFSSFFLCCILNLCNFNCFLRVKCYTERSEASRWQCYCL